MKDSNYRITLDVKQTQSQVTIPVKINDASRKLYISLTEGGTPYIISESCFAVLSGIKSDGTDFLNNCIIEDNVIRYDFTPQTVSAQGMVECEVILYDANGGLLVSPHLTIIVDERACRASSSASYNEHTFIDQALEAEAIRQSSEAARTTAEAARVSAENTRVSNENTRQSQETERTEAEFLRTLEEETRASNEEARKTNEAKRASAEQTRVSNETARATAESARVAAENARVNAEAERVNAEARREIAIETAKAMTIECEASGEVITLNDASNSPLSNLKVFGRTTQKTTTGKQKIAYPYVNTTKTVDGITFTNLGDGGVKVSGTATGGGAYFVLNGGYAGNKVAIPNWLVAGNSYAISGGNESVAVEVCLYENEGGTGKTFLKTFTMPSGYIYYGIFLYVPLNTKVDTIIYPMVRDASITDDTYEQYTGGIPSPNPNYPQNLVSVGKSGSFDVDIYSKNLLNIDKLISFTEADNVFKGVKCPLKKGKTYTLSFFSTVSGTNSQFTYTGLSGTDYRSPVIYPEADRKTIYTFTTEEDVDIVRLYINGTGTLVECMIEQGSILTKYEEYNKQFITIPYELRGVNDTEDEVNFNDGFCIEHICDGLKNDFSLQQHEATTDNYLVASVYNTGKALKAECLSSHFTRINSSDLGKKAGVFIYVSENAASPIHISVPKTIASDITALKQWLKDNNVKIYYPLANPSKRTFEILPNGMSSTCPLRDAFKALHTNKPNTIILNSESAHQEVTYVADTKTYIDKKFAAITASVDEGVV